jgi:hypothetical protein
MLSKFTTQSVGTRSSSAVRTNSETSPRLVRVNTATTTEPIRSATGSRISNCFQGTLGISSRLLLPSPRICFAVEHHQVPVHRIAEDLGAINAQGISPPLYLSCIVVRHPKAQHRHTPNASAYDGGHSTRQPDGNALRPDRTEGAI